MIQYSRRSCVLLQEVYLCNRSDERNLMDQVPEQNVRTRYQQVAPKQMYHERILVLHILRGPDVYRSIDMIQLNTWNTLFWHRMHVNTV